MDQARTPKIPREILHIALGYAAIGVVVHLLVRGFSFDPASILTYVVAWPIPLAMNLLYWTAKTFLWTLVPILLLLAWLARRDARPFALGCLSGAALLAFLLAR